MVNHNRKTRTWAWSQRLAAYAACGTMLIPVTPQTAHAIDEIVPEASAQMEPWDVALEPGGTLRGHVVDFQGAPRSGVAVQLCRGHECLQSATTSGNGGFALSDVTGGVYQLTDGSSVTVLRCWQPGTAPPHAVGQVLLGGQTATRGQVQPSAFSLSNPWVIVGITAAAIAIPVALYNNREDRDPASQ